MRSCVEQELELEEQEEQASCVRLRVKRDACGTIETVGRRAPASDRRRSRSPPLWPQPRQDPSRLLAEGICRSSGLRILDPCSRMALAMLLPTMAGGILGRKVKTEIG
jgi:hypothetical protein